MFLIKSLIFFNFYFLLKFNRFKNYLGFKTLIGVYFCIEGEEIFQSIRVKIASNSL